MKGFYVTIITDNGKRNVLKTFAETRRNIIDTVSNSLRKITNGLYADDCIDKYEIEDVFCSMRDELAHENSFTYEFGYCTFDVRIEPI